MQESAARSIDVTRALTSVLINPAAAASLSAVAGPHLDGDVNWAPDGGGRCNDPVFVLCCGRSGSTLLRFLLDAHPDLACPPETNLPALCAQLASVWSLIEGAPLSAEAPATSRRSSRRPAIAGIRRTLDMMVGPYLARPGQEAVLRQEPGRGASTRTCCCGSVPGAKFICLYRHPMDVIASGIEACPGA